MSRSPCLLSTELEVYIDYSQDLWESCKFFISILILKFLGEIVTFTMSHIYQIKGLQKYKNMNFI